MRTMPATMLGLCLVGAVWFIARDNALMAFLAGMAVTINVVNLLESE